MCLRLYRETSLCPSGAFMGVGELCVVTEELSAQDIYQLGKKMKSLYALFMAHVWGMLIYPLAIVANPSAFYQNLLM